MKQGIACVVAFGVIAVAPIGGLAADRIKGGALLGELAERGLHERLAVVSDDAGQFKVLRHACITTKPSGCWCLSARKSPCIPTTASAISVTT